MTEKEFRVNLFLMGWHQESIRTQYRPPAFMPQAPFAPPGFVELLNKTDYGSQYYPAPVVHIRTHSCMSNRAWKQFHSYTRALAYLIRQSQFRKVNHPCGTTRPI